MLEKQNNKCAICKKDRNIFKKRLCVDHCHSTGKIRGLLCTNCNQGIGHLKDDLNIIKSAIRYLEEYKDD